MRHTASTISKCYWEIKIFTSMCVFCSVYVIFYQHAVVCIIWRKPLYTPQNLCVWQASKCPESTLGVWKGRVRYRIIQQSVAVIMKLIVEEVLIVVFLILSFFPLSYCKTHKIIWRICNTSSISVSILSFLVMCRICVYLCFCELQCTIVP